MKKQLDDLTVYKIYKAEGSLSEIARNFNTSISTVRRIKKLEYKKYKDAIEKYSSEESKGNKIQDAFFNPPQPAKINMAKKEEIEKHKKIGEKIQNLNRDVLIADLIAILEKYFTPIVIKCVFDNILKNEKFEELLDATVEQIKRANDSKFYVDAVKTLFLGLLLQLLKEDSIPKILGG